MTWDDVTYPEPREPEDSWSGGAGEEPDRGQRYRLDPARPHPGDCGCSAHGSPQSLSWWARWRR